MEWTGRFFRLWREGVLDVGRLGFLSVKSRDGRWRSPQEVFFGEAYAPEHRAAADFGGWPGFPGRGAPLHPYWRNPTTVAEPVGRRSCVRRRVLDAGGTVAHDVQTAGASGASGRGDGLDEGGSRGAADDRRPAGDTAGRAIHRGLEALSSRPVEAKPPHRLPSRLGDPGGHREPGGPCPLCGLRCRRAGELFRFDLVIFDEASQLPPGDAIGVLLRAEQAVIFGDNKQLPPTDFFRAHAEGEEDDPDAQDYESILDIASVYFPGPMLRWHYRSRDERLIAFSNRHFYGGQLITFPAPGADGVQTGVSFVHVPDGVFGKGGSRTNRVEAERVAQLVLEHARTRSGLSLGVVAMSIEQRDAVEEALRRLLRAHPEVKLPDKEEFFVKNLETVQGDERDVIILSVGYGPSEPGGTPSLNFGPLSRMGGDRRLNVAITRARYRMIVVSSMTPEQLAGVVGQARWDGPKLLAGYLLYARRGGVDADVAGRGHPESEFEEAVRDALVARGYQVDCRVGVSGYRIDLAVKDPDVPGGYIVGIECDGATYHSARTARDRDRIRELALENLGWKILRVWSTEWIRDPARATERLVQAIERVRAERRADARRRDGQTEGQSWGPTQTRHPAPEAAGADGVGPGAASHEASAAAAASGAPGVAGGDDAPGVPRDNETSGDAAAAAETGIRLPPYQSYRGGREMVQAPTVVEEHPEVLAELVRRIVDVEAPVHLEQLYERVRGLYGHARAGRRIRDALSRAVGRAIRRGWVKRQGEFLWRAGQDPTSVRPRGPGEVARPPEHVCPEEWEAAALEVLRRLGATEQSRAARAVALAVLGYSRLSTRARDHVMQAVARLVARGEVLDLDGVLHVRSQGS